MLALGLDGEDLRALLVGQHDAGALKLAVEQRVALDDVSSRRSFLNQLRILLRASVVLTMPSQSRLGPCVWNWR